ncbi:MAG: peptide ABC transporter substrate-binding protein [Candidatus Viridilinea halotolerans]|uniref:Peptide ABC transporter substrate-binding protein n=1 Tax=Candidatus Viridilinea halotolerans TaxID=2491704 RepID=A0A426U0A4_9CHLR|nr:MAG: peptide ABC transporter substrate-binding protein [Candidatus Viridilinea halotolerans]
MRILRLTTLFICLLLLGACEVEGGVERPTLVGVAPTVASAPTTANPVATAASPVPDDALPPTQGSEASLRIGMLTDPGDLLPYHNDSADERLTAPITELLFPAPLLAVGYSYTTTGVLERVPSFENGDVTLSTVAVVRDGEESSGDATSTLTEAQQLQVTFRWNRELRWADGVPVTAGDSLFAYELARQLNLGQEAQSKLDLIERYEQLDAHTTRAVLRPDFMDAAYITTYFTPLPRHLLADVAPSDLFNHEFMLWPVGYGPYQIAERDQTKLRLVRNAHHPGPQSPFESINFLFRDNAELLWSAVAGGSLDLVAFDQPQSDVLTAIRAEAERGAFQVSSTASPIWEHLDFNLDVPLFQDIRVRRAVAHAINREAIAHDLLGGYGQVLASWIVPGQAAAAPPDLLTRYPYDPDEARRLLDEKQIVDSNGDGLRDINGEPVTLNLLTTQGSPLRLATAQRIRDDLAAVGLGLSIQELPTSALYSPDGPLFRRNFELALFAWIASPDPRGWERWSCAGVPSASNNWTGNNFAGWCFFEADRAIRTATTTLDPDERTAAYQRQQELFTQELPVLPLFQRVDLLVSNPQFTGISADPTAPFTWNMAQWGR